MGLELLQQLVSDLVEKLTGAVKVPCDGSEAAVTIGQHLYLAAALQIQIDGTLSPQINVLLTKRVWRRHFPEAGPALPFPQYNRSVQSFKPSSLEFR